MQVSGEAHELLEAGKYVFKGSQTGHTRAGRDHDTGAFAAGHPQPGPNRSSAAT